MDTLIKNLQNLKVNHEFGMAGIKYIQPDINQLTEADIQKAHDIVDDITTHINWGIPLEESIQNKTIIKMVEEIAEDEDDYFDAIYKHFNIQE